MASTSPPRTSLASSPSAHAASPARRKRARGRTIVAPRRRSGRRDPEPYQLRIHRTARRTFAETLPTKAAHAIADFLGPLRDNPHRVGKPLRRELAGYHAARRGGCRIVYRIDDRARTVTVVRIEHRSDVYRPR